MRDAGLARDIGADVGMLLVCLGFGFGCGRRLVFTMMQPERYWPEVARVLAARPFAPEPPRDRAGEGDERHDAACPHGVEREGLVGRVDRQQRRRVDDDEVRLAAVYVLDRPQQ